MAVVDGNNNLRRELFKMFYLEGTFDLSEKGDAQEALPEILKILHSTFINSESRYKQNHQ